MDTDPSPGSSAQTSCDPEDLPGERRLVAARSCLALYKGEFSFFNPPPS